MIRRSSIPASQQWFPAVQHYLHLRQGMSSRMLGYSPGRLGHHIVVDDHGPTTPALINCFVDVAVITGKVAAAVDLQDHLAQRNSSAAAHAKPISLDAGTEGRDGRHDSDRGSRKNALQSYVHGHRHASGHLVERHTAKVC